MKNINTYVDGADDTGIVAPCCPNCNSNNQVGENIIKMVPGMNLDDVAKIPSWRCYDCNIEFDYVF